MRGGDIMADKEERTVGEMEYILDGITTRMQMAMQNMNENSKNAMERMAESNEHMRKCNLALCITMIIVVLIIILGSIVTTSIWMGKMQNLREEMKVTEVVSAGEAIPQFGSGQGDR